MTGEGINHTVSIAYPGCFDDARIMHELLHTLGNLFKDCKKMKIKMRIFPNNFTSTKLDSSFKSLFKYSTFKPSFSLIVEMTFRIIHL